MDPALQGRRKYADVMRQSRSVHSPSSVGSMPARKVCFYSRQLSTGEARRQEIDILTRIYNCV